MADDNRWSDRDRDWRDDRRRMERDRDRDRGGGYGAYGGGGGQGYYGGGGGGQQSYYGSSGRSGRERWEEMHRDRSHEGPAGYNDSGPVQGGWSFGDREQGGERGQGYERYGYGRGAEERSFASRGSSEYGGGRGQGYGSQGYGSQGGPSGGEGREYGRAGDMGQQSFNQTHRTSGQDYAYGNYTPFGYKGSSEWDQRGSAVSGSREPQHYERDDQNRSWMERAGQRMASFFGAGEEGRQDERSHHMGEHRGRGPKGYRRSDERVREDVSDRLTDDPWLDASSIEVQVKDCEVTLSGTVKSREDKRRAETLAESVSAVNHVQNNLRVDQQQQGQWSQSGANMTSSSMGATTGSSGATTGSSGSTTSDPATGSSSVVGDISEGKNRRST